MESTMLAVITLIFSAGTLGGVVKLIFMLGQHEQRFEGLEHRLNILERKHT